MSTVKHGHAGRRFRPVDVRSVGSVLVMRRPGSRRPPARARRRDRPHHDGGETVHGKCVKRLIGANDSSGGGTISAYSAALTSSGATICAGQQVGRRQVPVCAPLRPRRSCRRPCAGRRHPPRGRRSRWHSRQTAPRGPTCAGRPVRGRRHLRRRAHTMASVRSTGPVSTANTRRRADQARASRGPRSSALALGPAAHGPRRRSAWRGARGRIRRIRCVTPVRPARVAAGHGRRTRPPGRRRADCQAGPLHP